MPEHMMCVLCCRHLFTAQYVFVRAERAGQEKVRDVDTGIGGQSREERERRNRSGGCSRYQRVAICSNCSSNNTSHEDRALKQRCRVSNLSCSTVAGKLTDVFSASYHEECLTCCRHLTSCAKGRFAPCLLVEFNSCFFYFMLH